MNTGNSKVKTTLVAAALVALALPAFAQGPDLVLEFTNLAPLDAAVEVYEGWAIVGGAPVSTGIFNVDASGQDHRSGHGPGDRHVQPRRGHLRRHGHQDLHRAGR
ncbi:MAG: hypothetical protein R3D98_02080 [Candidatus Krumholzibacteriia bacterium]